MVTFWGSPPLTRGKPVRRRLVRFWVGLIPAHAGRTQARPWTSWLPPARPRSREENPADDEWLMGCCGSSPLTRGKLTQPKLLSATGRLVPAHAGKTRLAASSWTARRAHPRSRGENKRMNLVEGSPSGSCPLTRGKPVHAARQLQHPRLIPAHAGKTGTSRCSSGGRGAHPRSRGENSTWSRACRLRAGSPPLTRGKPRV